MFWPLGTHMWYVFRRFNWIFAGFPSDQGGIFNKRLGAFKVFEREACHETKGTVTSIVKNCWQKPWYGFSWADPVLLRFVLSQP